jgi:protocadherin-15
VVAREKTGVAASSPLSFVVTLNDVNDNAPLLPMMAPITVQAGETKRQVAKVLFLFFESLSFLIISSSSSS